MNQNCGGGVSEAIQDKLANLIMTHKCEDLLKKQKVIQVSANMNVNEACETLVKNNISSAPVYDEFSKNYLGMIDFRDLVNYILIVSQGKGLEIKDDPAQILEWDLILSKALRGEPVKVRLTTDLSRKNPFYSVLPESPLMAAIDVMRTGIHRVNVIGQEQRIICVLTQSDILRHLVSDSDVLLAFNSLHVKDLNNIVHRPVIFIEEHETLLKALKKMTENGISSIAVVNAGRRLVGNISISDVRYLFKHNSMKSLWKTCVEFISSNLYEEGLEKGKDRYPFFDVTENSTIALVIGKLLATKTHRVWVVDSDNKLSGVISMTDILNVLCPDIDE